MSEPFGLGTFAAGDNRFPGLVRIEAEQVLDLRGDFGETATTRTLLEDWENALPRLASLASSSDASHALADLQAMSPVDPPGQILCAGANYHEHVRQIVFTTTRNQGDERSDDELRAFAEDVVRRRATEEDPFIFAALPAALCGAQDDVVLRGPGVQHDWELELAVVLGKGGTDIAENAAMDHVAGYTISNDISTRDVMHRPGFPMTDFLVTKNRPTFFPTGPYIVPKQFVPDYRDLRITLSVNGDVMQDSGVDDIIYGVERLIAYASSVTTLFPGDILLTGSPAGNAGHHGNRWLVPGDVMEGTVTGLGNQRNRCVAP